jgi:cystathionine beta-lyase
VQTPVYPPILGAPLHARLTRNEMQLTRLPDGRYEIDFDVLEQATTPRTRLFILCNPHNPVGRVFSRGELEHLADVCLRHRLIICSDEIHCDLLFAGNRHIPIASLHPEIAQRTMTLMAPSKTYNISGLQCALAIVQNPELRRQLKAARDGLIPRPNLFGYAAALAGFRHGQPWLDQVVRYLEANCGWLLEAVDALLPGVRMTRPEATYLAWMDCRQAGIPGNPYEFFLSRAKVALNDGTSFGAGGEGFVRLNFGCPRSILVEAISRMQAALDEVKGSPQ